MKILILIAIFFPYSAFIGALICFLIKLKRNKMKDKYEARGDDNHGYVIYKNDKQLSPKVYISQWQANLVIMYLQRGDTLEEIDKKMYGGN
jgi:hypothetical protein